MLVMNGKRTGKRDECGTGLADLVSTKLFALAGSAVGRGARKHFIGARL